MDKLRHKWKLLYQDWNVEKHRCVRCNLTRTKYMSKTGFPKLKYARNGVELANLRPDCEEATP